MGAGIQANTTERHLVYGLNIQNMQKYKIRKGKASLVTKHTSQKQEMKTQSQRLRLSCKASRIRNRQRISRWLVCKENNSAQQQQGEGARARTLQPCLHLLFRFRFH